MRIPEVLKSISNTKLEFIPTGFAKLDRELDGGFLRRELVVVGGPSGSGKSFLASQLAMNVADKGFKCLYLSLEISSQTIVSRMLGSRSSPSPCTASGRAPRCAAGSGHAPGCWAILSNILEARSNSSAVSSSLFHASSFPRSSFFTLLRWLSNRHGRRG